MRKSPKTTLTEELVITEKDYSVRLVWIIKSTWGTALVLLFLLYVSYNVQLETGDSSRVVESFIFVPIIIIQLIITSLRLINFHYAIKGKFIVVNQGILSKQQRLMHYGSIQNVLFKQDLYDKIFGLASITIENASYGAGNKTYRRSPTDLLGFSGNRICIPGLKKQNAEVLKNIILQKIKENPIQDKNSGL